MEAAAVGFKKIASLADLPQSGAGVAQVPMWTGASWKATSRLEDLSTSRTNKDANSIYTSVSHLRKDGTLFRQSVLTGGLSPNYTTRTVTYYDTDGLTVLGTEVFAITYSGTDVISETLQ